MSVSLDQLQAFVAAAETGSFSAAARKLRRAQSVVSTHVANLEADLGLELFRREGRNPSLTRAGQRLLQEARVVLERREHLIGVARRLSGDNALSAAVAAQDAVTAQRIVGRALAGG